MGYTFSYSELASDLGTQTADGLRNAANSAANYICDVYQSSPAWLLGNIIPGNPGSAFANALMGRLCAPRGKVPPPGNSNFSGGQCSVLYNFSTGTLKYNTDGSPDANGENVRSFTSIQGPLLGFRQNVGSSVVLGVTYTTYSPVFLYTGGQLALAAPSYNKPSVVRVFNIVKTAGGSDNCGDPSPIQPPSVTPSIPSLTNNNYVVNTGVTTINAPITIIPTLITANAFFRPVFNVSVGPFFVKFDLGGVKISPNFSFNTNKSFPVGTDPRPSPPSPYDPNTDSDLPAEQNPPLPNKDYTNILNDIKDCSCPVNYSVSTIALGSGIAGYSALPSNSIKVNMTITQSPSNAKTQKSYGSEPTNYFCGYYYWGDGTGRTERIPVSTLQSVFYKPDWATAFGWNLYLGYDCSVAASYLQPDKAGSQIATLQMKKAPS
jgi:hypothetical protein